jgi:hypothetical protein
MVEETHGGRDIRMQQEMWASFCKLVKWSVIGLAILLILMALFLL